LETGLFLLFQMTNISLVLTSLTLCGAIYYRLSSKSADLMRARLFMMASRVRGSLLLFIVGFSFLLAWESLLVPTQPPGLLAYSFDLAGEGFLLLGLLRFYTLVGPQVNLLGVPDDEIPEVVGAGHPGHPGGR
jgi:hypothetical protein